MGRTVCSFHQTFISVAVQVTAEKVSRFRPRKTAGPRCKSNQAKLLMQGFLGKPPIPSGPLFVFDTQPPAKPPTRMLLHGSVGATDRTQAEVVSPTIKLPVERCYQRCRILLV